jgi:hypothetical protein
MAAKRKKKATKKKAASKTNHNPLRVSVHVSKTATIDGGRYVYRIELTGTDRDKVTVGTLSATNETAARKRARSYLRRALAG